MHIAVVGSRVYMDLGAVRSFVGELPTDTVIVTGGARGVDLAAERAARARGLAVKIFKPDYAKHGRSAPLIRNVDIVKAADRVVAFWDGESAGTGYTISLARKLGKPVEIRRPISLPATADT